MNQPPPKRRRTSFGALLFHTPRHRGIPKTNILCPRGPKHKHVYPRWKEFLKSVRKELNSAGKRLYSVGKRLHPKWGIRTGQVWVTSANDDGLLVFIGSKLWVHLIDVHVQEVQNLQPNVITVTAKPLSRDPVGTHTDAVLNIEWAGVDLAFLSWVFKAHEALRQRSITYLVFSYLGRRRLLMNDKDVTRVVLLQPVELPLHWCSPEWCSYYHRDFAKHGGVNVMVPHEEDKLKAMPPRTLRAYQRVVLQNMADEGLKGLLFNLKKPMYLRGNEVYRVTSKLGLKASVSPDIFIDPTLSLKQRWEIACNSRCLHGYPTPGLVCPIQVKLVPEI